MSPNWHIFLEILVFEQFQISQIFSSFPFLSFQKSTFNKVLLPFFSLANNFPNFMILKRLEIKHEFNFVIPINGTYEINSCKNKRALVGAQHQINFHQNKIE